MVENVVLFSQSSENANLIVRSELLADEIDLDAYEYGEHRKTCTRGTK